MRSFLKLAFALLLAASPAYGKTANFSCMSTATTGTTSPLVLGSALQGFKTFAQAGVNNADIVSYGITDGTNTETARGVYTSSGTTLSRCASNCSSTNSDAPISLSGSATVCLDILAEDVREPLLANRTMYVRTPSASVTTTIATPAVLTATAHGLAVNDPVVLSMPADTKSVTITIATPGVVTDTAHGKVANQPVRLSTTGALPTGFLPNTTYFVVGASITTNTYQLSATSGGAAINTTGTQSGSHFVDKTGALPTGFVLGTVYYVISAGLTANNFELAATPGGAAINTTGTQSGLFTFSTGNDACNGQANTRGTSGACALLTPQKAWDILADSVDIQGYTVTVQLADGFYTAGISTTKSLTGVVTPGLRITGNTTTPANVLISTTGAAADPFLFTTGLSGGGNLRAYIRGMKLTGSGAGTDGIHAVGSGTNISFSEIDFGAVTKYHIEAAHAAWVGISTPSTYTISGSATSGHAFAASTAAVPIHGSIVTLLNTPAFGTFASAVTDGQVYENLSSFTGLATGFRFWAQGGYILGDGTGPASTFLPGDTQGLISAGGLYDDYRGDALVAASTTIVDATDKTKIVKFDVSGIATGTTRTPVWPNKNGTVAMTSDVPALTDVQDFAASGTWTKPTGAKWVEVYIFGGGGGGGGGARTASGTASSGGGGGGGGIANFLRVAAADVGTSETVTIGAAGAVGAGATVNGNAGVAGGGGGTSTFGSWISGFGGGGGAGGQLSGNSGGGGGGGAYGTGGDGAGATAGAAGTGTGVAGGTGGAGNPQAAYVGGAGGGGGTNAAAGNIGNRALNGGGSGGSGGGVATTPASLAGGSGFGGGQNRGGGTAGAAGIAAGAGGASTAGIAKFGGGGGGGGSNSAGVGGAGGAGSAGGGGGGGGGSAVGGNGGAGALGGAGYMRVITYF